MGPGGLCPVRLLFCCIDAKQGFEFFFFFKKLRMERGSVMSGKRGERSPAGGMICLECGV